MIKSHPLAVLLGGIVVVLAIASVIGWTLSRRFAGREDRGVIDNLNARIKSWWIMVFVFSLAVFAGRTVTVILFAFTSFFALREFVTLTPTKPADHRAIFLSFFFFLPFQYWCVATDWYGMFAIFIPVYAFLLVPIVVALRSDIDRFLERTAKMQWGLMVCVYFVSHAPALLILPIPGFEGKNALLMFFLVAVVQMSDVMQYVFGKLFGKTKIAPTLSPSKTWEGFVGGVLSTSLLGAGLFWITPFTPLQAFGMALIVTLMGFFGGLVMSAIKRDLRVKDWGNMIEGHGGMLDRIDSLCFAAPVFFHLTRYYFTP